MTALGGEVVDLGGVPIPLDDFIDFGQMGALYSESTTFDEINAEAISGLLSADGSLTLDGEDGEFGAAEIDLLSLFEVLGVNTLTDDVVDQALLRLGAGGAHVIAEDGVFLDQDGVGGAGQYRVAEASALVHSPLIEQASGEIYSTIGLIDTEMETQVNGLLDLTALTAALPVGVDLSETWVESNMQDEIFAALLDEPITTNNEFLTIDFSEGTATFHFDKLFSGELRPDQPTGLNAQNPNTELVDDELYPMIAESVHDAMEEVTNIVVGAIEGSLASVTVHFVATVEEPLLGNSATARWDVNLMGEISEPTCESTGVGGALLCTTLTTAIGLAGPVITSTITPIRDFVIGDAGQQIFDLLIRDIKTNSITVPIRAALEPFIELLAQVVSVQLNHQTTSVCTTGEGTELDDSLEVSALSLGLVQAMDLGRLNLGNAGVRMDACALAITPILDAASPAPAGTCAAITSGGWLPNTDVTFQLTDAAGNPAGDPVVVTTDANGDIPADTCVPIPADAAPGAYTVTGSDPDGNTATDTVDVYSPTMEADTPVPAGECAAITSGGWLPNTDVTFQLTDPAGNPVGDPVIVTTDANGDIPADTCVPIPADAAPGDYTIIGTDTNGAEVTAPVQVTPANTPTLDASSPVAAGDASEILESSGWQPNTDITLQLADPAGNPVGDPVVVTTDGNGDVPAGTTVPVPADAAPGDGYTITGTDPDGNTATDTIEVVPAGTPTLDASSPVPSGGNTEILTSSNWPPATQVTLQLSDPADNPVGDPVVVTTNPDGTIPAGTALPVPADAAPGDGYTVTGSDPDGNTATDTIDVYAPSLSATSPVPAGGESDLTSGGWQPNDPVTFQLTDPAGNPIGDPVIVTTDTNGDIPDGTTMPIPADAAPGDYTIVGTDTNGANVTAPLQVTPAVTPTLDASSPVAAGDASEILESSGWQPNTQVTLQLADPADNPTGDPVTVTTNGDGAIPAGTTVPIPSDATPGDGYTITGTDPNGTTATDTIEIVPADTTVATSLTPTFGPETGGTIATITGSGFDEATGVTFDEIPGTDFIVVSDTRVQVATPPHVPATVPVIVQSSNGDSNPLEFTFEPAPAVASSIDPNEGPELGGTVVTITGSGFDEATGVTFDGEPGTSFTVDSDTQITVTTPPGVAGPAEVIVQSPFGDSDPLAFTYLPADATITGIDPDTGPEAGGQTVTITGVGFASGVDSVTFDGSPGTEATIVSGTELTVVTPSHESGIVEVIVNYTATGPSNPLGYTYVPDGATASGIDPVEGPETGGTVVTITGTDFTEATGVTFDGIIGTEFIVVSDTEIRVTTPPHAPGPVDVIVLQPNGDGDPLEFTYLTIERARIDDVDPDTGPTSGGNIVTITGECFTGATDVLFDGESALEFTVIDDNTIEAVPPPHAAGTVDVTVIGSEDCGNSTLPDGYTYDPDAPNPRVFLRPVDPARYWDTREEPTFDGAFGNTGRLSAGMSFEIQITGRGNVPVGAKGVVANLVADKTADAGYATLYACDTTPPVASHVNYLADQTVSNNVVVPLSEDGRVCALTSAATDMVLDVNGYIDPTAPDAMIKPTRYLDTREIGNSGTFDHESEGGGPIDGVVEVPIAGRGDIPDNAKAAIVNVTAVDTTDLGYVTVFPCDERPTASNINYYPGDVMPNGVVATLSNTGTVCVYTSAPANLLIDVAGHVPDYIDTTEVASPGRLFDSRAGEPLVDGASNATRLAAGDTVEIQVAGRAGVPEDAISAILNVASENPLPYGYVTLYPCDEPREKTSNLNWTNELVRANNSITALGADGTVCVFALVDTDIVVDVTGWLMKFDP